MSLETKVMDALKEAMRNKDDASKRAIRAIKAAILLKKTDGSGTELDEAAEIKLLQKLAKQRTESLAIYNEQGRADLAKIESEELEVIKRFLPEQMDENTIRSVVEEIIASTGASSMKDMGKVMGVANQKLAGKADGKTIASIVKEILS